MRIYTVAKRDCTDRNDNINFAHRSPGRGKSSLQGNRDDCATRFRACSPRGDAVPGETRCPMGAQPNALNWFFDPIGSLISSPDFIHDNHVLCRSQRSSRTGLT
jgi:hypothetical protein